MLSHSFLDALQTVGYSRGFGLFPSLVLHLGLLLCFRQPEVLRGLEADQCYYFLAEKLAADARARARKSMDLADYPNPDLAVEMLEVGESTGALPAMLNSVAEFYEEDVQTALGASMALIEPLILIVMAVFVGGVLISLYLPIFSLGMQSAH